ncbi:hypothetical protein A6A04_20410 [Paramagnetospirillum marisnigri]|uniref:Uncharacterized protein n=1 Tax=Paramagnetospirillum marisnigri TaxID=1285242 RepID=A0A178MF53_9PROT|nr:hypothetical protein [Paramagnetospirillum marisnigri]OAN47166.1 hypothetical protein A6A04_20410 [Paramagnetospirillum marisnigri]
MPGTVAYEKVMADIGLLEQCFGYFRASRDKFIQVLVDAEQRQVNDDNAKLSCGRTLNEVVAMIVRSAAFRYFRLRVVERKSPQRPKEPVGVLARALSSLGLRRSMPAPEAASRAEQLYKAIRQYLLYEWQVPLVPAYSQLSPADVSRLGPRIVELRSPEDLLVAAGRRAPPTVVPAATAAPCAPSPVEQWSVRPKTAEPPTNLSDLLTPDGSRLRMEALSGLLGEPAVLEASGNAEQTAAVTSALAAVGRVLVKSLVSDLGLDKRQLAVCLLSAQNAMPPSAFEQLARASENDAAMLRFMLAVRRAKLTVQSSLPDCAAIIAAAVKPK